MQIYEYFEQIAMFEEIFCGYTDRTHNAITYKFICVCINTGTLWSKSHVMK